MATDHELLNEAKEVIKKQNEILERLGEAAFLLASVTGTTDQNKLVVVTSGDSYVINPVPGVGVGDQVWILPDTKQIVQKVTRTGTGPLVEVKRAHEGNIAEIDVGGRPMLVTLAKGLKVEQGDRVMLDHSGSVIVAMIEKAKKPALVPSVTPVQWHEIGGNREAKRRVIEAIELPYKHPKLFAGYGRKPPKGILFYGPPGCGKTLLGKAIATSIGSTGGFISVKGPELLDPYVGVAEANIRALFRHAEEWKAKTGKPGVIFIDEADALLAARGTAHNYMGQTIVPMFLTEMQGLEESGAIVILATNRHDILDPAVIRDGRIDAKIEIPRPDVQDAEEILAIHIDGKPLARGVAKAPMAKNVAEDLYKGPRLPFSGALLEGLVAKASDHAIRRDLDCNASKPSGLCPGDFVYAMAQTYKQEGVTVASGA